MDLSIIILTYNNKNLLEECIRSIKANTKVISYELIVVDNNSTDGTQDHVRRIFPDIKLIDNEKNLGFTRANNKGLKIAKGRYSLILNDDTYLRTDAFSDVVKYMDSDTSIAICGPKLLNTDGTVQHQGSVFTARTWRSKEPVFVDMVIGACMFIRAAALERIGIFDENLFFYNDDIDLCRRARSSGYKVAYYPLAGIYHVGGMTMKKSFNKLLFTEGYRGGLYFCKKHYGLIAYQAYRLVLYFLVLLVLPFSIFNRKKLEAYSDILKMIMTGEIVRDMI